MSKLLQNKGCMQTNISEFVFTFISQGVFNYFKWREKVQFFTPQPHRLEGIVVAWAAGGWPGELYYGYLVLQ